MTTKLLLENRSPPKFRIERFVDEGVSDISLIKIGEYVRTPLYEPSIRSMRLSLSHIRKQLEADKKSNEKFREAWLEAVRIYKKKESNLTSKFKGPAEYCIALICFTLDAPFKIYSDFSKKCQQLVVDSWGGFPYKSLFYLLIQAETRMRNNDEYEEGSERPANDFSSKTDLDISSSITEDVELEEHELPPGESKVSSSRNSVDTHPKNQAVHRLYRGFDFAVGEKDLKPRDLVAFTQIIPTTLEEATLKRGLTGRRKRVTLLEIDQVSWSSRYIAALSMFPFEKEVIIWPWIKFYVEERKMIGGNVEKIVLKPTSQSFLGSDSGLL